MFTKTAAVAALAGLAAAAPAPISKRAGVNDATVLNYALTLEHLEATFYRQALANYTQEMFVAAGFADPFYSNLKAISADEDTHVSFLTSALQAAGATPVAACTYSFPATDPKSFAALSAVLEGVGVSAYIGAAHFIANPNYLTAAGTILTVESRHSAYIRSSTQQQYPFPQAFDTPLDFDEVYTLAAPFIASCPASNPALPVKAFPSLAVSSTGPIQQNSTVTISTPGYTLVAPPGGALYAAWIAVTGPTFVNVTAVNGGFQVPVPPGFAGQSYVVLTSCTDSVSDDTVAAGPAIVEIEGALGN